MNKWPRVKFGEIMTPNQRAYQLAADEDANLVGMRLYGGGPFHRELKPAMRIAKKSHFVIRKGDVIYNKLFAWKGTFGIVPPELDGMFVSDKFPTYELDRNLVDEEWLRWYFRWPPLWEEAQAMSTGSAALSKLTLNPPKFLHLTMPLPSLGEQRRTVAKLRELDIRIGEARVLRADALHQSEQLLVAMAHRRDLDEQSKVREGWRQMKLGHVLTLVHDAVRVQATESYPNVGIYSFARGLFRKPPIDGTLSSAATLYRVKQGQFIYSRLFAFEGAYGIVSPEFDGCFVSNEYPTFDCDISQARVEFVGAYFRASAVWGALAAGSKGLGNRRQRVQPDEILRHEVWLPPLAWQDQLVEVHRQLRAANSLQHETSRTLGALLPAILDRTFKGELVGVA